MISSTMPIAAPPFRWTHLALALCSCVLASCFGAEPDTRVRIRVAADGSGHVHARSLLVDEVPSPMTDGGAGVTWEDPAAIVFTRGHFERLDGLRLHEIGFSLTPAATGFSVLTVTLPRGPEVRWARALSSGDGKQRHDAGNRIDPDARRAAGEELGLEIQFPREIISEGLRRRAAGVSHSREGTSATLRMQTDTALAPGEELVWIITY